MKRKPSMVRWGVLMIAVLVGGCASAPSFAKEGADSLGKDPECSVHGALKDAVRARVPAERGPSVAATPRQKGDLVGWYELPRRDRHTREALPGPGILIPVLKRAGGYYSVSAYVEVPLKECVGGLEWGLAESSMKGTTIGIETNSGRPYIVIKDAQRACMDDNYVDGETQFMSRTEAPSWIPDMTSSPPATNRDFAGFYTLAWLPDVRVAVTVSNGLCRVATEFQDGGGWKQEGGVVDLLPIQGRLGFACDQGKDYAVRFVFNQELGRFEMEAGRTPDLVRIPLARLKDGILSGSGKPDSHPEIGIPAWR